MHRLLVLLILVVVVVGCAPLPSDSATETIGHSATRVNQLLDDLSRELARDNPDMSRVRDLVDDVRSEAANLEDQAWTINAVLESLMAANGYTP